VAREGQAVLLDRFLPADISGPRARYRLKSGQHSFCLQGDDPYFTGLTLSDDDGKVLFRMPRGEHCRSVRLPKGTYTLRARHSNAVPDPDKLTFLGVDEPTPPLHDANGNPLGGYWAITPLNGNDVDTGVLRPAPPPRNLGDIYSNDMPLIADFQGFQWNEESLFSFPPSGPPVPLGPPGFFLDMTYIDSPETTWVVVSGNHDCNQRPALCNFFGQSPNNSYHRTLAINDLGHYEFTFSWPAGSSSLYFSAQNSAFSPNSLQGNSGSAPQGTKMFTQFRYYPDSTQMQPLNQGEVAFFEKCNYQGKSVVATNSFEPSSYSINGNSNNQFLSVRLSNNTTVQLSTLDTPGGTPSQSYFVFEDTACLPASLFVANLIYPIDKVISGNQTFACPNCRLVNANLSNVNIQDSDWQQANMSGATLSTVQFSAQTNLSGAKFVKGTLSNVSFEGATLTGADFTGATLNCVDLSGTQTSPRDLTVVNLSGAIWQTGSSCRNNLSYTRLSTTTLPPTFWKTANLTGAVFTDLTPGMPLSTQANPLDLTGAQLSGVDFKQVSLDYAVMPSAHLEGASLGGCSLRHANISGATLYGTNLDTANLDGASLSKAFLNAGAGGHAATLVGAFLRNANLSGAQLSGADFTNASFFGTNASGLSQCAIVSGFTQACASASGATLNNAEFSGAFLFGVDFSSSNIQGVHFGNAILIGANFDKASLTGDTQLGTDSGFPGAFLQGTNFSTASQLLNISMINAYLDFSSQGNAFVTQLSGNHTLFPGSSNPGQPICVQMIYSNGSTVPTNNGTMRCPDSSQPSTGCGGTTAQNTAWKSKVDISAVGSYQFDATYTPAATQPFCSLDPNNNWFTGGLGNVRKKH
jgi:uncharacterized protein YjbI with pentapeptide repeats